jgi:hypothetical protein
MSEDNSLIDATGDVAKIAIFTGVASLLFGGVKKVAKKSGLYDENNKNEVKWF